MIKPPRGVALLQNFSSHSHATDLCIIDSVMFNVSKLSCPDFTFCKTEDRGLVDYEYLKLKV